MGKFKYEPIPSEAMEKATQAGGDFDSFFTDIVKMQKVEEGEHTFRVLPRTWDSKQWGPYWYVEAWVHRNIGPDKSSYLCPLKMKGEPCPICEAIADLDPENDKEYINKVRAGRRMFAYIIDRKTPKDGVKVWGFGVKLRRAITQRCQDKKTKEWLQISDPDEGYDISFRRNGTTITNTEYVGEDVDRDSTPLSEKASQQEMWMNFVIENPLADQFIFQDYDYLNKVFRGKQGTRQDRADDAADRKAAPAKGRARAQEPEEEPEEDNEEAEAAEAAAAARAAKKPAKKKQLEPVDSDVLLKMDDEELTQLVEEYELDIEVTNVPVKKLRREVIAALEEKKLLAEDDEIPEAIANGKAGKPAAKAKPDEEEDDGEGGTVTQAKKSLERIRPGRR